ncbi:MAG: RidA family protein [Phycisphaerales bacterium]
MTTEDLHSTRAPEPVGPYPHAKRVGNLVFFSGVGPRKRGTKEIPGVRFAPDGSVAATDIEVQCRSCFDNLRAVCDDAKVPWSTIVDVTVYLTDIGRDFQVYNRVYAEYFAGPGNPNPCRTTLGITALPTPIAVEVKAIAVVA